MVMMTIEDKLYTVRFKTDDESHLSIKSEQVCRDKCPDKLCVIFCPAEVYEWDEENSTMMVAYEGCLECGTCRLACPHDNIDWEYPRGGFGPMFKGG